MSVALLTKLSYVLLIIGIAGLAAAVVLFYRLELSRAWRILFAAPKKQKAKTPKRKAQKSPAATARLLPEDTVILYEETLLHTTQVI